MNNNQINPQTDADQSQSVLKQNLASNNTANDVPQIHVVHNPAEEKVEEKTKEKEEILSNESSVSNEVVTEQAPKQVIAPIKINVVSEDRPVNFQAVDKKDEITENRIKPQDAASEIPTSPAQEEPEVKKELPETPKAQDKIDVEKTENSESPVQTINNEIPNDEPKLSEITPEHSITKPSVINSEIEVDLEQPKKFDDDYLSDESSAISTSDYANGSDKDKPNTIFPPVKQASTHRRTVAIVTTAAAFVLVIGLFGGFYGYGKLPNPFSGLTTSADVETETIANDQTEETSADTIEEKTVAPEENQTAEATSYTNTKYGYSLDIPNNWFSQNTDNKEAKSIQLTSYDPEKTTKPTGGKIEILYVVLKGQTLSDYVKANNLVNGITKANQATIKVSGLNAIQQKTSDETENISTYIPMKNNALIVSIYMADNNTSKLAETYNNLLKNIEIK